METAVSIALLSVISRTLIPNSLQITMYAGMLPHSVQNSARYADAGMLALEHTTIRCHPQGCGLSEVQRVSPASCESYDMAAICFAKSS